MPAKGYTQITGIAWSGGGKITRIEISTDGGKNWRDGKLQIPVHTKAHTRFTFDWDWQGQEAVIQSRSTDETGEFQPTLQDMSKYWGHHDGRVAPEGQQAARHPHDRAAAVESEQGREHFRCALRLRSF
jgi:hypothetical protein